MSLTILCRLLPSISHSDVFRFRSLALDGYALPNSSSTVMPISSSLYSVLCGGNVMAFAQFETVWSETPSTSASSSCFRIPSFSPSRSRNSLIFSPSMPII